MRRPWRAIGAWLLFVVIALALGIAAGTKQLENGAVGESARGYALMDEHGAWPPTREYGYVHSAQLTAAQGPFRAAVADVRRRMQKGLGSTPVVYVSPDRHAVLVAGVVRRFDAFGSFRSSVLAAGAAHPEVTIEESGDITASDARDRVVTNDLHRAELFSIPVTLIILLFAFGAVVAALVPVLLALTAVAATFGLLGLISQAFPLDDSVKTVVLLIGMAVGVDYALFYVIRSREERHRGLSSHEALERTARTSGRTVLISGTTVAIAMAGMFVLGLDIFNGIASGTITVIACAVAGSVTVLPAVLELLGARIDKGRIPFLPHLETDSRSSRFWPAVVDRVLRRPLLSCLVSAGLLVALALPGSAAARGQAGRRGPCLTQRAGSRDAGQDPDELPERGGLGDRRRRGAPRLGAEGEGCDRRARTARARGWNRAPAVHRQWKRPPGRIDRVSAERRGRRCSEQARDLDAPERAGPSDPRPDPGRRDRCHRDDRGGRRLHAPDEARHPLRDRLRARPRVPAPARRVQVDRRADQGDRAQPALGGGGLRSARARLPAPLGRADPRLHVERLDHLVAPALPVRRPLRAVDGLPRVHPQPDPRSGRFRDDHGRGCPLRDHGHGRAW